MDVDSGRYRHDIDLSLHIGPKGRVSSFPSTLSDFYFHRSESQLSGILYVLHNCKYYALYRLVRFYS
jgi:hypothetical protein